MATLAGRTVHGPSAEAKGSRDPVSRENTVTFTHLEIRCLRISSLFSFQPLYGMAKEY